jgi:hypothetical protein
VELKDIVVTDADIDKISRNVAIYTASIFRLKRMGLELGEKPDPLALHPP